MPAGCGNRVIIGIRPPPLGDAGDVSAARPTGVVVFHQGIGAESRGAGGCGISLVAQLRTLVFARLPTLSPVLAILPFALGQPNVPETPKLRAVL